MGYERYPRDSGLGDYYGDRDRMDYGQDYGSGRAYTYSSARQYAAAGELGQNRDRDRSYGQRESGSRDYGSRDYGPREYGNSGYAEREQFNLNRGSGRRYVRDNGFQGSYGAEGQRFTETDARENGRDDGRGYRQHDRSGAYGGQARGYE